MLAIDFFQEGIQRELIWLYLVSGHQANAIRQYNLLVRKLRKEFGVTPMDMTRALYKHILQDTFRHKDKVQVSEHIHNLALKRLIKKRFFSAQA